MLVEVREKADWDEGLVSWVELCEIITTSEDVDNSGDETIVEGNTD